MLKKPLQLHDSFILDADNKLVGYEYAEQMVLEMNAFDDLLAQLTWIITYIDHNAAGLLQDFDSERIQAAIAKARGEA